MPPTSSSEEPDAIELTGLSDANLRELRPREPTDHAWNALLRVTVAAPGPPGGDAPLPMVGEYAVIDGGIRFQPRFPLGPGRPYNVVFDSFHLAAPDRAEPSRSALIHAVVSAAATATVSPTRVVAVYPTAPEIPENQLRLYISFSAPMSLTAAVDHVKLLDEAGHDVEAPFLPIDVELWNADRTRFTLLFDPGRVKTGILPNEHMGRALVRRIRRHASAVLFLDAEAALLVGQPARRQQVRHPEVSLVAGVLEDRLLVVDRHWVGIRPRPQPSRRVV